MENRDEKWQLFWCHLLYPVIYEELEGSGITDYLRGLSQSEILFPDGKRRKPSMSTLWRKVRAYRKENTRGFVKKRRKDRGKIRVVDQEILDKAIEIKKDQPKRSAPVINALLQEYYGTTLSKSTLYDLKIKLLHRPPGDPPCGGIIEKFFQTAQSQFESEVRAGDILDLDRLNKAFSAWLNVAYHQSIHSETGQSPRERYESGLLAPVQGISLETSIRFFMKKEKRKVHPDFSDISLYGRLYKVDPKLRGDSVVVRFDEFGDSQEVLIYSLSEEYLGKGVLHQREKQDQPQSDHKQGKPKHDYIGLLEKQHDTLLNKQARGIDYIRAIENKKWPLTSFMTTLGGLLGRKGGASAFSTDEMESLQKVHSRLDNLNESLLMEAAQIAEQKSIPHIVYNLQQLQERS